MDSGKFFMSYFKNQAVGKEKQQAYDRHKNCVICEFFKIFLPCPV